MKRFIVALALTLAASSPFGVTLPSNPTQTLLWNNFNSVVDVGDYVIAAGNEGMAVLAYNDTSASFVGVDFLFLDTEPLRIKMVGDSLLVQGRTGVLYLITTESLPELNLVARIDPDRVYEDYALRGNSLYLAAGFNGIQRYIVQSNGDLTFADSSMLGIHCMQLEISDTMLYLLDDYNGILRYNIKNKSLNHFQDILYVPLQAKLFAIGKDALVLSTLSGSVILAQVNQPQMTITATLWNDLPLRSLVMWDRFAVGVAENSNNTFYMFDLILKKLYFQNTTWGVTSPGQGTFYTPFDRHFLFPIDNGGLGELTILPAYFLTSFRQIYSRPGPINDVVIQDTILYTGGVANPLDQYSIRSNGSIAFDEAIIGGSKPLTDLYVNGDTLFAMYSSLEQILVLKKDSVGFTLLTSIPVTSDPKRFTLLPFASDSIQLGTVINNNVVEIFALRDTLPAERVQHFGTVGVIGDVVLYDSLLVFTTNKRELWVYRLYNDLSMEFRALIGTGQSIIDLEIVESAPGSAASSGHTLYGFGRQNMFEFDLTNPTEPRIAYSSSLPIDIDAVATDDTLLYTIGDLGIGVFTTASGRPEFIESGGRGGKMIDAANGLIVTSDGHSLHSYQYTTPISDIPPDEQLTPELELAQNYPNPFNPSTTISFSLHQLSRVDVSIYNLLGQRVKQLLYGEFGIGTYLVEWDGTDAAGQDVASGVYFYRVNAGRAIESRKMILVR